MTLQNYFGEMSLFFILLEAFENEILPILCFIEFPSEAVMSWILVCSIFFLIIDSLIYSHQSIQSICFLSTQFMQTVFLDTCPFLLGCIIFWHMVHSIFLLFFFCISAVLIAYFVYLGPLFFVCEPS